MKNFIITVLIMASCLSPVFAGDILDVQTHEINEKMKNLEIETSYMEIKNIENPQARQRINNTLKYFVTDFIHEYKTELKEAESSGDFFNPWMLSLSPHLKYYQHGLLSVTYTGYAYMGGAHGMPVLETYIFDTNTGKQLKQDDIFLPGSDYLDYLSRYTIEHLARKLRDKDYLKQGAAPDKQNFNLFYLSEEGMVFVFPPYQLAPYVEGIQAVTIPYAKLKNYFNPTSSLKKLTD